MKYGQMLTRHNGESELSSIGYFVFRCSNGVCVRYDTVNGRSTINCEELNIAEWHDSYSSGLMRLAELVGQNMV